MDGERPSCGTSGHDLSIGGHRFADEEFGGVERVVHVGRPGRVAREFHEVALREEAGDEVAMGVGKLARGEGVADEFLGGAFRRAQAADPDCAMCGWGEAMARGPNINAPMDADAVAACVVQAPADVIAALG